MSQKQFPDGYVLVVIDGNPYWIPNDAGDTDDDGDESPLVALVGVVLFILVAAIVGVFLNWLVSWSCK